MTLIEVAHIAIAYEEIRLTSAEPLADHFLQGNAGADVTLDDGNLHAESC